MAKKKAGMKRAMFFVALYGFFTALGVLSILLDW